MMGWEGNQHKKEVLTSEYLKKCHPHRPKCPVPDVCHACGGTGKIEDKECSTCNGTGENWDWD